MKRKSFRLITIVVVSFSFCTPPPLLDYVTVNDNIGNLLNRGELVSMLGSGDIDVSVHGSKYTGSADIIIKSDSLFTIDVYSPFGISILSMRCDSGIGVVTLQDTTLSFNNDQYMTMLPFSWGKTITFGVFQNLLTSQLNMFSELLSTQPDSIVKGKTYILHWGDDHSELLIEVNRRTGTMDKITYLLDKSEETAVQFSNFLGTMARRIKFFDNDKNYFIINYDKITTVFN